MRQKEKFIRLLSDWLQGENYEEEEAHSGKDAEVQPAARGVCCIYGGLNLRRETGKSLGIQKTKRGMVSKRKMTHPSSNMDPEHNEDNTGGHSMEVIDFFGADAQCRYKEFYPSTVRSTAWKIEKEIEHSPLMRFFVPKAVIRGI